MADFNIGIGADYTQLQTDLNQVKSKTLNFFDKMTKQTTIKVHAQLDNKALDTAYAQFRDKVKKYNVRRKNAVFDIKDIEGNILESFDFSKPAKTMQEVEDRAKKIAKVLYDLNSTTTGMFISDKKGVNAEVSLRRLYDLYNKLIASKKTYNDLASKSFLEYRTNNTKGLISSYGDDENSLKRKVQLWEKLRSEYVKYETETGITQQKNIAMIDAEIDSIRKLQNEMSGLGKYSKKNATLTEKLDFAQQNGDIQHQIQLMKQLRDLNLEYYGSIKDTQYRDNAERYQKMYESLKKYNAQQKVDEANQKKIAAIEEKRDELNRRLNNLQGSNKRADLVEQANLYRQLATAEQNLYNVTKDLAHRDNADYYRNQAKAIRELANEQMKYGTIARKEKAIQNLQGGIISNPKTTAELNTNIRLLQRIISLQHDLQGAGKPQNITASMKDLERYKKMLHDITAEGKKTNTSFTRQGGILRDLISYAKMYVSIWQAVRLVRNIAETTGEFEKQKAALKAIVQDGASAVKLFNQLKDYSLQTPKTFQELVTNAKQLTAYQIPFDDLFDTTKRLADLSSGLGVDMNRIILAYGQIGAASVLRGQEVRQLTEAGIPIINELAKAFSQLEGRAVSTAEVFKKISERGVSFEMVKNILWDMTDAGGKFYNMQEKLMETDIYGPMQKMKDVWTQTLDEMGRSASTGSLKKGINLILDAMKNWRTILIGIGGLLAGQILTGIINFASQLKTIIAGITTLKAVTGVIGVISTAVGFLVGHFVNLNAQANKFRNAISEVNTEYGKKANELVENFNKLAKALNDSAEGSKNEEDALRKLQSAYAEYLPQQDLTIERLRDQKKGYDDLTDAILKNVDAQRSAALDESYRNNLSGVIDTELTKDNKRINKIPGLKSALSEYILGTISGNADAEFDLSKIADIYNNLVKGGNSETFLMDIGKSLQGIIDKNKKMIADTETEKRAFRIGSSLAYTGLDVETLNKLEAIEENFKKSVEELNKDENLNDPNKILDRSEVYSRKYNSEYMKSSIIPRLSALGLDFNADEALGISDQLLNGANGTIIADWLKKLVYNNSTDIEGGNTEAFNKLSKANQKFVENIISELVEKFYDIGAMGTAVNKVVKEVGLENKFIWGKETVLKEYRENVKKAYSEAISESKELADQNDTEYKSLQEKIKAYKELAAIIGIKLDDGSKSNSTGKSASTSADEKAIRSELKNLKLAYKQYEELKRYMSEGAAFAAMKAMSQDTIAKFFKSGTFDYDAELAKIVKDAKDKVGEELANTMQEEGEREEQKNDEALALKNFKKDIEAIDRAFANSSNAREYFKQLIEAGLSWQEAVKYAKEIDATFDMSKKASTLLMEQFYDYLQRMNVSDNGIKIDNVAGIRKMQDYIRGNDQIDMQSQLLDILDKLLAQLKEENVSEQKAKSKGYGYFQFGKQEEYYDVIRNGAGLNTPEGNSGVIAALQSLYSMSDKGTMLYGSKTDAMVAALKLALSENNTELAKEITDTLPFAKGIKDAINEGDEEKVNKRTNFYQIAGNIGEYTTEIANIAEAMREIVEDIDSTIEALGGDVDRNDAFHTTLNAFTGVTSGISSMWQSALNLDIAGVLKGAVSIITNPIKAIAQAGDNRLQDDIEDLTKEIKDLDNHISNLNREAALVAGSNKWSYNSEARADLYNQLEAAESILDDEKSKKNTDDDAISDYEQQVEDYKLKIRESWQEVSDEIIMSVDDISSRLGDALRDAFENGKNAARSWKEAVNSYINDVMYNLFKTNELDPKVEELKNEYEEELKDEQKEKAATYVASTFGWNYEGAGSASNYQRAYDYVMKYGTKEQQDKFLSYVTKYEDYFAEAMKDDEKRNEYIEDLYNLLNDIDYESYNTGLSSSTSSASSNTLQSMTEDTANRLEAIWNTHLSYVVNIDSNVSSIFANTNGIKSTLATMNNTLDAMKQNQVSMLDYFNGWANGTRYVQVKM